MACFLVPMAEAIVLSVVQTQVKRKENMVAASAAEIALPAPAEKPQITWSRKLSWLNKMLWGGSLLLAVEHIWHGEVVPWPPFLTAMTVPGAVGPMLQEMAIFGTSMAVFITVVWGVMVLIADHKSKKAIALSQAQE
jgi:hypothetical protein